MARWPTGKVPPPGPSRPDRGLSPSSTGPTTEPKRRKTMSEPINHSRRRFLRDAAMTIAAAEFALVGPADARSRKTNRTENCLQALTKKGNIMDRTQALSVVLVHGGFVDGAGWEGVYKTLKRDGYKVSIVQNPTLSLAGDVSATKLIIAAQDRPVLLVGHSYGGAVITEAGNDPRVEALVYITAFAPDKGESVSTLIKDPPPGAPVPPILPPQSGFLFLDKEKFHASFAADVAAEKAAFMADSQVPWGVEALGGTISQAAWRTKPSWYLIVTEDKMIPPP